MFARILIANRGETACRIWRTCQRLGVAAATIHSSADRDAHHVREIGHSVEIGGAAARESYLNAGAIVDAALDAGAEAVHPGIGFLSEDPAFARAVEAAGLAFVGPSPETLERYADKALAKREARAAGVPVIEGSGDGSADPARIADLVRGMPSPVVLKAIAGGGGRGMRIIRGYDRLEDEIASAMREAESAFGRPDLLVEVLVDPARHIEVQVAGDGAGKVIHLFERECSLQRRYQKVVEEAPAPSLGDELRGALVEAACRIAERARFRGIGTVEFLVSGGHHYFLEVNPRLQVEHPTTEMITGLDLVELQLRIAAGEGLALAQDDVTASGHAIEARLYAEDTADGFAPAAGTLRAFAIPAREVRVDVGVALGETVTPHYDPLLAKVIAHGTDRGQALARLAGAIGGTSILGIATNVGFLEALLNSPEVIAGAVDNRIIDRNIEALVAHRTDNAAPVHAIAAALWLLDQRKGPPSDPWTARAGFTAWRLGPCDRDPLRQPTLVVRIGGEDRGIAFGRTGWNGEIEILVEGQPVALRIADQDDDGYRVSAAGEVSVVGAVREGDTVHFNGPFGTHTATIARAPSARAGAGGGAGHGRVLAPVMGQVVKINVRVGETVNAGDILVVQESMKMELRIAAPCDGVVARIGCVEGDMVERHSFVVELEPLNEAAE
jgi:3-methylcrotonyl-CoA carboxylase alpha subunit